MAQVSVVTVEKVEENGKLDMESGSEETKEPTEMVRNGVSDPNFPKGAVDEWPAPMQMHTFYFVRYRPFDDPKIKSNIELADKEITKRNQSRFQILEALKAKRTEQVELISQLKVLNAERRQCTSILGEKRKEIEPLQQALGKLRNNSGAGHGGLCSSEEELNDLISSLQYRIQHESITLSEEKQILREIKQLEGTREKVIANAAMRAKIENSLGQKEAILDQVKLIGFDLDGVRKERQVVSVKITQLEEKTRALDNEIKRLQDELMDVTQKRDSSYERIQQLRKHRDEGNSNYYQSRTLLNKAKELAAMKDVKALKELAYAEMEKFMSNWSHEKKFRDDYEKRILPSLDSRQLSKDGRIRNPDERPLIAVEKPTPSESVPTTKGIVKQPKEELKTFAKEDSTLKEASKANSKAKKTKSEHSEIDQNDVSALDKQEKNPPAETNEAKLKELKREEEIAKAKLAMERKKKLAEKAAAKAAIRAQKEAEKKLKDREKKLKKKNSTAAPGTDPGDTADEVAEAAEPEKVEDLSDEVPSPVQKKEKGKKENSIRYRNRTRAIDSLPKVILRRRKSNYWMWAAPAAVLALILLTFTCYYTL